MTVLSHTGNRWQSAEEKATFQGLSWGFGDPTCLLPAASDSPPLLPTLPPPTPPNPCLHPSHTGSPAAVCRLWIHSHLKVSALAPHHPAGLCLGFSQLELSVLDLGSVTVSQRGHPLPPSSNEASSEPFP